MEEIRRWGMNQAPTLQPWWVFCLSRTFLAPLLPLFPLVAWIVPTFIVIGPPAVRSADDSFDLRVYQLIYQRGTIGSPLNIIGFALDRLKVLLLGF
jgi:hypothetical protein